MTNLTVSDGRYASDRSAAQTFSDAGASSRILREQTTEELVPNEENHNALALQSGQEQLCAELHHGFDAISQKL